MSLWLLLARPFIEQAYKDECLRLRTVANHDLVRKKRKTAPKDAEISALALRNLFLFPRISSSGHLEFTKPMTHAAATSQLAEMRSFAGMEDRAFTWHGVVSL